MALPERENSPRLAAALMVAGIITILTVVSCSKKQETTTTWESGSTGGAKVHVDQIVLGREMTADRRVITVDKATFTPGDTVFASVVLAAPVPAAQLVGRWKAADGTVVYESTQALQPSQDEAAVIFHMVKPAGLAPGAYRLEVLADGQVAGTKEVTVVAPQ